jgi:hypothetical protein
MTDRAFDITLDPSVGFQIADLIREFDSEGFEPQSDIEQPDEMDDPRSAPLDMDTFEIELTELIDQLNEDAQRDLLALAWVGRGDYQADDWSNARRQARETKHMHVAQYLKQTPLASDYLIEGLIQLGYSRTD